jgi:hypothetical protein
MNAKVTSFKLQSFKKLFLIVSLNYMVLQTCLAELISSHIAYFSLDWFNVLITIPFQNNAWHQFEDLRRKPPISLSCRDQLSVSSDTW